MRFSNFFVAIFFLAPSFNAFAQSLPIDEFGFDSPVVESTEPARSFQFNLLGPSILHGSALLEKIESTFAQVGCELSEVKIVRRSPHETKMSALSADCETPISPLPEGSECRAGFERVRITFVDSTLRLVNGAKFNSDNQFCVRVSL